MGRIVYIAVCSLRQRKATGLNISDEVPCADIYLLLCFAHIIVY